MVDTADKYIKTPHFPKAFNDSPSKKAAAVERLKDKGDYELYVLAHDLIKMEGELEAKRINDDPSTSNYEYVARKDGLPTWLIHLRAELFLGLAKEKRADFERKMYAMISPGTNLDLYLHKIIAHYLEIAARYAFRNRVAIAALRQVQDLHNEAMILSRGFEESRWRAEAKLMTACIEWAHVIWPNAHASQVARIEPEGELVVGMLQAAFHAAQWYQMGEQFGVTSMVSCIAESTSARAYDELAFGLLSILHSGEAPPVRPNV